MTGLRSLLEEPKSSQSFSSGLAGSFRLKMNMGEYLKSCEKDPRKVSDVELDHRASPRRPPNHERSTVPPQEDGV